MTRSTNLSLEAHALEVARDLILENNDGPLTTEHLLAICFMRGFGEGWQDAYSEGLNLLQASMDWRKRTSEVARV